MSPSRSLERPQGRWFVVVSSLLSLAMPPVVNADTIIYDNTVNFRGAIISGREAEWGDGATLAATDRVVTRISLMIHAVDGDHSSDVRVRLFEGGDDGLNLPGAMLWESELFEQMNILEGSNLYDFDIPNVTVPDSLTWTLKLSNVGGSKGTVGPRFMDPPVVGSSQEHFWQRTAQGTWFRGFAHLYPNFGARIEAVPEPGTLVLLAFAAALLLRNRGAGQRPLDPSMP